MAMPAVLNLTDLAVTSPGATAGAPRRLLLCVRMIVLRLRLFAEIVAVLEGTSRLFWISVRVMARLEATLMLPMVITISTMSLSTLEGCATCEMDFLRLNGL